MQNHRSVKELFIVKDAIEGAGVHLHRGFSNPELPKFDPFLLFDDFSSENPADYLPGFPMHPHRGIETVTYILGGTVEHQDSIGTHGQITKGDVQWMTAGSGILHQEMPKGERGLKGFQLWVNLPAENKMMNPRYQEVKANQIPTVSYGDNAVVRVIAGAIKDVDAPVTDIMAEPAYLDVTLTKPGEITLPITIGHNAFIYVFDGSVRVRGKRIKSGSVALLDRTGDSVHVETTSEDARFLLASGKPLNEPIAWYGPIVMNTQDELQLAVADLHSGTFIRT